MPRIPATSPAPTQPEYVMAYEMGFEAGVASEEDGTYCAHRCYALCPPEFKTPDGGIMAHPLGREFVRGWKDGW